MAASRQSCSEIANFFKLKAFHMNTISYVILSDKYLFNVINVFWPFS